MTLYSSGKVSRFQANGLRLCMAYIMEVLHVYSKVLPIILNPS